MLVVDYDPHVDVLRVVTGSFAQTETLGKDRGVELDFDAASDTPSGATVVGYRRNRWHADLEELATIVAAHVKRDPQTVASAILKKTGGSRN
jgi:hypothetical protein